MCDCRDAVGKNVARTVLTNAEHFSGVVEEKTERERGRKQSVKLSLKNGFAGLSQS